jgi:mannose-6-phosphate isomerase
MDPLFFAPYLRPMVWGGRRLESLGKRLPPDGAYGESWEISGHPHHVSRVAEGPQRGLSINELCADHAAELFGIQARPLARFPLLVKLLDCHDWLSLQVHPNDETAKRLAPQEAGKTEVWIVLEAAPTGRIYAGLLPGTTRGDLERHLAAGSVDRCLHVLAPQAGDCVFLPAGTVHAVGGGVLLAEVQQTSDATFRLFDWNRLGPDGKPRSLHLEEALQALDWTAGPMPPVTPQALRGLPAGVRGESLVKCPYFALERFKLGGPLAVQRGRLGIWLVLEGSARLQSSNGRYDRACRRGDTLLAPAVGDDLSWHPFANTTLLRIQLP